MKKIVFFILTFVFVVPFAKAEECDWNVISRYQNEISDFSYNLVYLDNVVSMNGDALIGYFRLDFSGLSSAYRVVVETKDGDMYSNENNGIILNGGVYNLSIYNSACENSIKKVPISIPYYKQYCGLQYECAEGTDVWFDGTYENMGASESEKESFKLNTRLIAVLASLIIIIAAFFLFNAIRKKVPR